jgi:hypothetical protein
LEEGEFYWAAAGPVYIDIRRGFQVKNLVDRIKSEKGTLRSRMKAFIANSKQPIAKELASIRKDDRTFFAKLLTYNSLLQIVFVGFEEEHPAFVWASLTAREVNGRVVVDGTVEEPPRDQSSGLLGIGETIQAQEYIRKNGSRLATDPIGVIRESIIVQELAEPQMVGGNVSILQISRDGKQWIDKGVCK